MLQVHTRVMRIVLCTPLTPPKKRISINDIIDEQYLKGTSSDPPPPRPPRAPRAGLGLGLGTPATYFWVEYPKKKKVLEPNKTLPGPSKFINPNSGAKWHSD